ncbi:MAG: response regulator [Desulfobulbaceae bacterium]|nr:response regulator [Desulfobulbaceae bacterium]
MILNSTAIILIVGDDDQSRDALAQGLVEQDYAVKVRAFFSVNIPEILTISPDLIIFDVHRETVEPYRLCDEIRIEEMLKDVPVLFRCAKDDEELMRKAFACGAVDFVRSSHSREEIVIRVGIHLSMSEKLRKLNEFNKAMIGRELRVVELKEEVNRLAKELGRATPYQEIWSHMSREA